MTKIIFAKTRYVYDSYTDYWKLVELSGFPICYVDEIDLFANNTTYIVCPMNGEMYEHLKGIDNLSYYVNARLVMWNLERPSGSNNLIQYVDDNIKLLGKYFHNIIISDRHLALNCRIHSGDDRFMYMPLGIHEELGHPGAFSDKYYDLITLSCYSNNRSWLFNTPHELKSVIQGCSLATNAWGETRDKYLTESKFMLNIHQDGLPYIEPLRFVLAAAYGLPLITEYCTNFYPYNDNIAAIYIYGKSVFRNIVDRYDQAMYNKALDFRDYMLVHYNFKTIVEETFS